MGCYPGHPLEYYHKQIRVSPLYGTGYVFLILLPVFYVLRTRQVLAVTKGLVLNVKRNLLKALFPDS